MSEEIFSKVREARKIVFTLANTQIAVVPSTSVNKEIAKDFLRFLYSKEGFDVYAKETGGARLPVNDYQLDASLVASMSTFGKSIKEIAEGDTEYIFTGSSDPIRYRAGHERVFEKRKARAFPRQKIQSPDGERDFGEGKGTRVLQLEYVHEHGFLRGGGK